MEKLCLVTGKTPAIYIYFKLMYVPWWAKQLLLRSSSYKSSKDQTPSFYLTHNASNADTKINFLYKPLVLKITIFYILNYSIYFQSCEIMMSIITTPGRANLWIIYLLKQNFQLTSLHLTNGFQSFFFRNLIYWLP